MYNFERMLTHGYFPKELPPSFSTEAFGGWMNRFQDKLEPMKGYSECMHYDYSRGNGLRRKLSIPNPVHYAKLCQKIESCWDVIEKLYDDNKVSLTLPSFAESQRAVTQDWADKLSATRLERLHHAKYIVHIDVSNFYGSIYTHSIPWALHGKEYAKQKLRDRTSIPGDAIDTAMRNLQGKQTVGLPVGPDASLIIAEAILSAIDKEISKTGIPKYFRYMDDFEFPCSDKKDVTKITTTMEHVLEKFELSINNLKYKVTSVPFEIEATWASELKHCKPTAKSNCRMQRQRQELLYFFNRASSLSNDWKNESVLRFSLSLLQSVEIHEENKDISLYFILQTMMSENFVYDLAFTAIFYGKYAENVHNFNELLKRVLEKSIKASIESRMHATTSWAIWCSIAFEIHLERNTIEYIIKNGDSISKIIALHCVDTFRMSRCRVDSIRDIVKTQALTTEHWMLIYEACASGHVRLPYIVDEISPFFDELKSNNIHFYDFTTHPKAIATSLFTREHIDSRTSRYE